MFSDVSKKVLNVVLTDMVLTDINVMAKADQSDTNSEAETGDALICMDGQPAVLLVDCRSEHPFILFLTCAYNLGMTEAELQNYATMFVCIGENHICCILQTPPVIPPLPPDDPL